MKAVGRPIACLVAVAAAQCAVAQTTLGALLDAGATPLSVAQFKDELVQRVVAGPTPTGGRLEVMYTTNGAIQGNGTVQGYDSAFSPWTSVSGEWTVEDGNRICTTLRIGGTGTTSRPLVLPKRCQYWYKLDTRYFFADSDTDRSAKVGSRTIKQ